MVDLLKMCLSIFKIPLPIWCKSLNSKPQSRSLPFRGEAGLRNSVLHGFCISQNSFHKWKMIYYPSCLSWVRSNGWNKTECVWYGWGRAHQESLHEKQNKTKKCLNVSLGGFPILLKCKYGFSWEFYFSVHLLSITLFNGFVYIVYLTLSKKDDALLEELKG